MFLVMGITGKVGGATAEHLLAHDKEVRALVRNRERAANRANPGVEQRGMDGPRRRRYGANSEYDVRARCIQGCTERRQDVTSGGIRHYTAAARFSLRRTRRGKRSTVQSSTKRLHLLISGGFSCSVS